MMHPCTAPAQAKEQVEYLGMAKHMPLTASKEEANNPICTCLATQAFAVTLSVDRNERS
jgi:hypothetical protein